MSNPYDKRLVTNLSKAERERIMALMERLLRVPEADTPMRIVVPNMLGRVVA